MYIQNINKINIVIFTGFHRVGSTAMRKYFSMHPQLNYFRSQSITRLPLQENKINVWYNDELSISHPSDDPEKYTDRKNILDLLKGMFPKAKIVIGIRNKDTWLKSCYNNYIISGGILSFEEYVRTYEQNIKRIDFKEYIEYAKKLFPTFVYRQEDLLQNPAKCLSDVSRFIGVPYTQYLPGRHNVSMNQKKQRALRTLNRYLKSEFNKKGLIPLPVYKSIMRWVGGIHAKDY